MHRLIVTTLSAAVAFALAASASAAGPLHFNHAEHDLLVDDTCGFAIVGDIVFTNDVTEFDNPDGTIAGLQLHQTAVGTWTGKNVTLSENDHATIFVAFTDGSPTQAKHAGLSFHLQGPDGKIFQIAGQEVFTVVNGFDRDLIALHGIDIDFDPGTFCAAFG